MKGFTSIRAIAIAVPFAMAGGLQAKADSLEELAAAAEAEGGTVTWCNGSIPDAAMQGILEEFTAEYPNVHLEGIRSTSQVAYQRLHQDLQMGLANCDLFSSSDYSHFYELQEGGHLLEYSPEREAELQEAFADLYEPGYFYPGMVGTMVIAHSDAVDPEEAPRSWQDLLDPRWQDQLAVGHPGYSGYVATWALMISQMYGWEYFEEFEALNPMIGRSATDAVNQLVSGERQVAAAPGQTVIRMSSDADLTMVFPEDGVLLMSSPVAIIATTERPEAAKLVLEFMLGETYSRTVQQYGYEALNRNVPPVEGGVRFDEINTRRPSTESIQNDIGETIENWRDIFGG